MGLISLGAICLFNIIPIVDLFIFVRSTRGPARDDMRVTAEPSTGDVEIGLHTVSEGDPPVPGSNASTMSSTMSSCTERDSNDSSEIGVDENSLRECELVRSVLYATRDNVNIVHEVFRQVRISSPSVCVSDVVLEDMSLASGILKDTFASP